MLHIYNMHSVGCFPLHKGPTASGVSSKRRRQCKVNEMVTFEKVDGSHY